MTLYIANPSKQNWRFYFREPVNQLVNAIRLESGTQTEIGHGWTAEQQAKVIEQLERFGARDAAETHAAMASFQGLIYRDRGVISEAEIRMAHAAETQAREERSVSAATKNALAFDRTARSRTRERPSARETEVTVKQEVMPGEHPKGNEVDFNIAVTPDGRSDLRLPT